MAYIVTYTLIFIARLLHPRRNLCLRAGVLTPDSDLIGYSRRYCAGLSPDLHPFIFLLKDYSDSIRS